MPSAFCGKWEEKVICLKWGAEKVRCLDRMQNFHKAAVTERKRLARDTDNDRLHEMRAWAPFCSKEWHLWAVPGCLGYGLQEGTLMSHRELRVSARALLPQLTVGSKPDK